MTIPQPDLRPFELAVGDSTITGLFEQPLDDINRLLGVDNEHVRRLGWLQRQHATEDGALLGNVQAFLVRHGGFTIMVDTGVGNAKDIEVVPEWANGATPFLDRLRALGVPPESVDFVVCTHLHLDHVGWQTWSDGSAWHPTFVNARHVYSRQEFEFWQSQRLSPPRSTDGVSDELEMLHILFDRTQRRVQEQSVLPVVEAGLVDLVEPPHDVVPGFRLLSTPGHTPGHVSVEIRSGDERAVISGDLFHHPCQIARPEWAAISDVDQELSTASRRSLLAQLAGTPTRLVGTHFAEPWAGLIVADNGSYRFDPVL